MKWCTIVLKSIDSENPFGTPYSPSTIFYLFFSLLENSLKMLPVSFPFSLEFHPDFTSITPSNHPFRGTNDPLMTKSHCQFSTILICPVIGILHNLPLKWWSFFSHIVSKILHKIPFSLSLFLSLSFDLFCWFLFFQISNCWSAFIFLNLYLLPRWSHRVSWLYHLYADESQTVVQLITVLFFPLLGLEILEAAFSHTT